MVLSHRDGAPHWTLRLPKLEAELVNSLPARLEDVLTHPARNRPIIDRLFPASYDDPAQQALHRNLLGASLLESRGNLLREIKASLAAARRPRDGLQLELDAAGVDLWLRFLNDLRLIFATQLGLDKSPSEIEIKAEDPLAFEHTLLVYLGGLEAVLVEAISGPPPA
ncbi:MAG: DUF2017 family protein [Planctomycetota bacterium]